MLLWLLWFTVTLSRRLFGAVRKQSAAIRRPETKPQEAVVSVLEAPESELAGKRFAFGEQLMVGRGRDNHIVIPEGYVSHHHAQIYRHGNQYVIEDLGSINHTYVNGQIQQARVYPRPG
ncbi:FHA domain-containing protein, partial [Mitsuokella jalaludinii]|uniref:FHA domain-containing protein n=1 Tax=Mitsuokella jalaludinii TaxID=187979 RepID=UPI00307A6284